VTAALVCYQRRPSPLNDGGRSVQSNFCRCSIDQLIFQSSATCSSRSGAIRGTAAAVTFTASVRQRGPQSCLFCLLSRLRHMVLEEVHPPSDSNRTRDRVQSPRSAQSPRGERGHTDRHHRLPTVVSWTSLERTITESETLWMSLHISSKMNQTRARQRQRRRRRRCTESSFVPRKPTAVPWPGGRSRTTKVRSKATSLTLVYQWVTAVLSSHVPNRVLNLGYQRCLKMTRTREASRRG